MAMTVGYVPSSYDEPPQGEQYDNIPSSPAGIHTTHSAQQEELHWSSGICACCDDIPICCLGCWCPCVLFGQNVEMLEERHWVGPCVIHLLLWGAVTVACCVLTEGTAVGVLASCVPCYACSYRKAIRTKYNLEDEPCGDILTHLCCHLCANCQEYRELKGCAIGYHGLPVTEPPPIQTMGVAVSKTSSSSSQNELNDFPN